MSVGVTVDKRQGSTMGTMIVKVTDPEVELAEVRFYTKVGAEGELGPFAPDILRRPSPGLYEKDIVLDSTANTVVRVALTLANGTLGPAVAPQTFTPRDLNATVGGGQVKVQDDDTPSTTATSLAFQGNVVSVSNGVASFDLDGRYITTDTANAALLNYYSKGESDGRYSLAAHTHAYLPLSGGVVTGSVRTTGTDSGFVNVDRTSGTHWYDYANGNARAFWYSGTGTDRVIIDGATGNLWAAGHLAGSALTVGRGGARDVPVDILGHTRVASSTNSNDVTGSGVEIRELNLAGPGVDLWATAPRLGFHWIGRAAAQIGLGAGGDLWCLNQNASGLVSMVARTFIAESANAGNGGAVLGRTNLWGGGAIYYPFVGSTADSCIMLAKPHLPFMPGYGAFVRMAADGPASAIWDMGLVGDQFVVRRMGTSHLTGFSNGGFRFHADVDVAGTTLLGTTYMRNMPLYLRASGDTNHGLMPTASFGGVSTDGPALFGFAGGILGSTNGGQKAALVWDASMNVQVRGNLYSAGGVTAGGGVTVEGGTSGHGNVRISNEAHWDGTNLFPTIGGTTDPYGAGRRTGLIMLLAPHIPHIAGYGAFVRMATTSPTSATTWDMGCFGDQWGVRRGTGSLLLVNDAGVITNRYGHALAASLSGTVSPTDPATEGTLYIQY